jgi:hypothetical protein
VHTFCPSAVKPVPFQVPKDKYLSKPEDWAEDAWKCLKFSLQDSQLCQYSYESNGESEFGAAATATATATCDPAGDGKLLKVVLRCRGADNGEAICDPVEVDAEGQKPGGPVATTTKPPAPASGASTSAGPPLAVPTFDLPRTPDGQTTPPDVLVKLGKALNEYQRILKSNKTADWKPISAQDHKTWNDVAPSIPVRAKAPLADPSPLAGCTRPPVTEGAVATIVSGCTLKVTVKSKPPNDSHVRLKCLDAEGAYLKDDSKTLRGVDAAGDRVNIDTGNFAYFCVLAGGTQIELSLTTD